MGRGRTPADPAALDAGAVLSGTTGAVLDPVFSLRRRVRVEAETSVHVAFTTAAADSREEALAQADYFHDFHGVTRAFELAWAHSQVELRQLHLTAQEAHLYQRLAAHVIYAGPALRPPPEVLLANEQGQAGLWRNGISGDNPIVLVRVAEAAHLGLVRQLLAAHAYWRAKGLEADLVLLNEDPSGYFEDLQEELLALVRASADRSLQDKPGGAFVRKGAQMSHEDRVLLQAASRCVLAGDRGTLAVQLDRLERAAGSRPAPRSPRRRLTDAGTRADRNGTTDAGPSKLLFANGLGGFTPDGKEYVIRLAPPAQPAGRGKEAGGRRDAGAGLLLPPIQYPPAPWANVVANPSFGFLVTERGGGCTWAGNSQTNRLTPWSNDPAFRPARRDRLPARRRHGRVLDADAAPGRRGGPSGDAWIPTTYTAHHGQGYTVFKHISHGLSQELLLFVPRGRSGEGDSPEGAQPRPAGAPAVGGVLRRMGAGHDPR